jgi:putative membrane protein
MSLGIPSFGPMAQHMAMHILAMNLAAPLIAMFLLRTRPLAPTGRALALATVLQLALLWAWHAPGVLASALHDPVLHVAMQLSLFAAALWFWLAVLAQKGAARWLAMAALLITGKLFCLLGVLLVFTPRVLYSPGVVALPDQQLAGLLMIAACPATYVAVGVVIAWRWLAELGPAEARTG